MGIGVIRSAIMGSLFIGVLAAALIRASVGPVGDASGHSAPSGWLLIVGGIFVAVSVLAWGTAWFGALVRTARRRQWGWFAVILAVVWLGLIGYVLNNPTEPAPKVGVEPAHT